MQTVSTKHLLYGASHSLSTGVLQGGVMTCVVQPRTLAWFNKWFQSHTFSDDGDGIRM